MKKKELGLIETKLFHFHRIFKTGGGEGVQVNSLKPSGFEPYLVAKSEDRLSHENAVLSSAFASFYSLFYFIFIFIRSGRLSPRH